MVKVIENLFENDNLICDYGCGKIAKYRFSNGKICCKDHYAKCEGVRNKYSISHIGQKSNKKNKKYNEIYGTEKSDEIKKKQRNRKILDLEKIKYKYPELFKVEEFRINPKNELEIQGICKNCNCWFTLTYPQIYERYRNIKHKSKANLYFFCSNKCKEESKDYYSNRYLINPNTFKRFMIYKKEVIRETEKTIRIHKSKIKNIELRGIKYKYELDHKYSIYSGFCQKVNPKIVSHWKNLKILTQSKNRSKHKKNSLTLQELLNEIKNSE
jgi:hypothetical protein